MEIPAWGIGRDGAEARIGTRGGVVLSWSVPGARGERVEILDGYRDRTERRGGDGSRQALLLPWSNRVADARYTWDGRAFDLGPDEDGNREALHGLALWRDFELVEESDSRLRLRARLDDDAYPVPLDVEVAYSLGHDTDGDGRDSWSLDLVVAARNRGTVDAPVAMGWHPYVRFLGGHAGARLELPASWHVRVDDRLIPLAGDDAFEAADDPRAPGVVGDDRVVTLLDPHELDDAWTGLGASDGRATATLHHANGARTTLEADTRIDGMPGSAFARGGNESGIPLPEAHRGIGIVHLFTGEPLANRPHQALAMEYCQFMTNAYNRPELADALRLAPGATRTMHCRLVHRA